MEEIAGVELDTWAAAEYGARAEVLPIAKQAPGDTTGGVAPPNGEAWAWHARELHDGVTQDIWYLQLELTSLVDRVPSSLPDLRGDIERLKKVAQDAYEELRATLKWLNSHSTPKVDLTAELVELTLKFSKSLGMEVEFQHSAEVRKVEVPGKVGREIRRLVHEALWNSWRHSMSTHARVGIQPSKFGLVITVSDDGCGFRLDEVDESHYGLRNMRERAEVIQGKLYLSSRPGKGTVVTLHVPQEVLRPESMRSGEEERIHDSTTTGC